MDAADYELAGKLPRVSAAVAALYQSGTNHHIETPT